MNFDISNRQPFAEKSTNIDECSMKISEQIFAYTHPSIHKNLITSVIEKLSELRENQKTILEKECESLTIPLL